MSMHLLFYVLIFVFVVLPLACMWFAMRAPFGHEDKSGFHYDQAPISARQHRKLLKAISRFLARGKPEANVGCSSGNPAAANPANPEGKPESNIGELNSTGCGGRSHFRDAINMELGQREIEDGPIRVTVECPPCEPFARPVKIKHSKLP